jgi:hypothetical protein
MDLYIYIETIEEMLDRLEQVDECAIAGCDAPGSLVRLGVTKIPMYALENGTYSK